MVTVNPDLISAIAVLLFASVGAKANQKIVDQFKRFQVFANSTPLIKQGVALISAQVLVWLSAFLKIKFSSNDVTALGANDVLTVLTGLATWFASMHFHDAAPKEA